DEERIQNIPNVLTRHPNLTFVATEKLDGCLHESDIIETENGEMSIKEICETKYTGKVKSFDHITNEMVFDQIVNYSIKEDNSDWYEIETECGQKVILTSEHYVWV